ncbi:hypothetical protein [Bradyrhizobium canariense]|uniref:Uncharacterized protein n=1 Tax=Bradyrhizobium canariense TaxID=255045 RepID=A0A1H1N2H4_9BRAD|nr:hypothetical protein [Bradyrhizobium canariense]SDR93253.1 hypothetical protein SAMN05444158_0458 [Bradyrhizobium canariense]
MKSYLVTIAAIIIVPILVMMSLAGTGVYACFKCELLRYQESKIALASEAETIVLGDSSIGYALDAEEFSDLSGKKTLNMALTGYDYGIGGVYVLLTELLSKVHPKNVLISLTPQTFSVSISQIHDRPIQGFVQASRRHPQMLFTVNRKISLKVAKTAAVQLFDKQFLMDGIEYLRGGRVAVPDSFSKYDYLEPSNNVLHLAKTATITWEPESSHDYDVFFGKIAKLCETHGLNCLYMHGPLVKLVVEQNQEFIENLGDRIERTGIKVIRPSPIAIPDADLGNTINHVRPGVRLAYTRKVYELVRESLR